MLDHSAAPALVSILNRFCLRPHIKTAGQVLDAAFSLVQLRKVLEDTAALGGMSGASSAVAALQDACQQCEAALGEVSGVQGVVVCGTGDARWLCMIGLSVPDPCAPWHACTRVHPSVVER